MKDKDGNTPLHLAAMAGNVKAIEGGLLNDEIWSPEEQEVGSLGQEEEGGRVEEDDVWCEFIVIPVGEKEELQTVVLLHALAFIMWGN